MPKSERPSVSVWQRFANVEKSASKPDDTQWDQLTEFVGHLTAANLKRLAMLLK